jgi:hypothetical protein
LIVSFTAKGSFLKQSLSALYKQNQLVEKFFKAFFLIVSARISDDLIIQIKVWKIITLSKFIFLRSKSAAKLEQ